MFDERRVVFIRPARCVRQRLSFFSLRIGVRFLATVIATPSSNSKIVLPAVCHRTRILTVFTTEDGSVEPPVRQKPWDKQDASKTQEPIDCLLLCIHDCLCRSNKCAGSGFSKRLGELEEPVEEGGINIIDQKTGRIVWCKLEGYNLWSCVIMDCQDLNSRPPKFAHQWVMLYGDHKTAQVEYHTIFTFPAGWKKMESELKGMKDELFCNAVFQAVKDFCERF
ncbi:hypothetical protein QAD02_021511 [Eretmocerus hayati]|uniref:Uncharacterized protein n=1 Tax=Eretmocerus hayati TaxID=131215 RepID=A0ACC2PQH2_9HYME|nr:hypothetical protein QAD02_021511 [Eretmocerus hayati]